MNLRLPVLRLSGSNADTARIGSGLFSLVDAFFDDLFDDLFPLWVTVDFSPNCSTCDTHLVEQA